MSAQKILYGLNKTELWAEFGWMATSGDLFCRQTALSSEKWNRWKMVGLELYFRRKINEGKLELREEPVRNTNCSRRDDVD